MSVEQMNTLQISQSFSPSRLVDSDAQAGLGMTVGQITGFRHGFWDFPGSPVVKILPSNAGGEGSLPGQEAKIPHALWPKKQNVKQKQYCNKFNKD